ncbi:MAG: alpha/beta hydrolase [Actinobacteria bacterium]|nr:MAG: alpha/beta hydrolase [Actinomycetota bacterium]
MAPREVVVQADSVELNGDLGMPGQPAQGIVLFAHGSGSSRLSPRNRRVGEILRDSGLATLLFDLLTVEEEAVDIQTAELRFDIPFLAARLAGATRWVAQEAETSALPVGYFGASTGAAAALVAATTIGESVKAIVSRGGRPDLAKEALPLVKAATLLIVGGNDYPVIGLNREALEQLTAEKQLAIVPGATHLFEEPGALEHVARLASDWFRRYLT